MVEKRLAKRSTYFDEKRHAYFIDGKRVPGTGTVLELSGFKPSGGYGMGAKYLKRGRDVHKIIELHNKGLLAEDSVHRDYEGYYNGYLRWFDGAGVEVIKPIEEPLFHRVNRYGGIPDFCILGKGVQPPFDLEVVDAKSGDPELWHRKQLAGYIELVNQWLVAQHTARSKPQRVGGRLLYLAANGKVHQEAFDEYSVQHETYLFACACHVANEIIDTGQFKFKESERVYE